MSKMLVKKGWNLISKSYQEKTKISLEDVHYGPISPGELKLKLLGDVNGKDVLEIACGGGQNAIVLSKWGAKSVGLDISEEQIRHARKIAEEEGVDVQFYIGNMEDLSMFHDASFDVVLSSFGIGYTENLRRTFQGIFRVLRNNGLFIFAEVHPIADRGKIARYGKRRIWLMSNYFDKRRRKWTWKINGRTAKFYGSHRTVQDYFDSLVGEGFIVERILEPKTYPVNKMGMLESKKIPYVEAGFLRDYDIWRKVPYTIIFKARKP